MAIWMENPQQRKGRSLDALKKAEGHPVVIVAVARLFWAERKIEKTRQWMEKAISADSDWGDAWGWWLKFERQHGEVQRQQAVIDNCKIAQPHHGPVWQSVAKGLDNVGKSTQDILEMVAERLQ